MIILCGLLFLVGSASDAVDYHGAPMLQEKVDSGILPPVKDRLPEEPLVVNVDQIGTYGGTAYTASLAPKGWGDDFMMMDVACGFVKPKADMSGFENNFAEKVTSSDDKKTWTLYMRKGVKWSNGVPVTTKDLKFWYDHVLQNSDLTPVTPRYFVGKEKMMGMTIIDDYTVQFKFDASKPFFINSLGHWDGLDMLRHPEHYMKQFHPDFVDEDEIVKQAKTEGFDTWFQYYQDKALSTGQASFNPDKPIVGPYRLVSINSSRRIWERNPYFWKVDQEGNQLPYLDGIECEILSDKEVLNGKLMSGELDFGGFYTDIRNYPMFKQYEEKSGIRTILWKSGNANSVVYKFNQNHKNPYLREVIQDVRFRRAMSLGINRQEINEAIFFNKATPMQMTGFYTSSYYKEEFAEAYIDFDPEKANKLLDEIGLDKRDSEGFRLLPNGERLGFTVLVVPQETPKKPNAEIVVNNWQDLGVDAKMQVVTRNFKESKTAGNNHDVDLWHGDFATDILFQNNAAVLVPIRSGVSWAPLWGTWLDTKGEAGEEPPENIKQLHKWYITMLTEPSEEKRIELAQNILESQAENLWEIGTVGKTPYPIVVNDKLRNVPEEGFWSWDSLWMTTRHPSQWFFEGGENI